MATQPDPCRQWARPAAPTSWPRRSLWDQPLQTAARASPAWAESGEHSPTARCGARAPSHTVSAGTGRGGGTVPVPVLGAHPW